MSLFFTNSQIQSSLSDVHSPWRIVIYDVEGISPSTEQQSY